jgi:hypothetical protein
MTIFPSLFSIVLLASPVMACNQPIVKNGSCPLGYYSSGGYCIPSR